MFRLISTERRFAADCWREEGVRVVGEWRRAQWVWLGCWDVGMDCEELVVYCLHFEVLNLVTL
jgi:hypothetical protein